VRARREASVGTTRRPPLRPETSRPTLAGRDARASARARASERNIQPRPPSTARASRPTADVRPRWHRTVRVWRLKGVTEWCVVARCRASSAAQGAMWQRPEQGTTSARSVGRNDKESVQNLWFKDRDCSQVDKECHFYTRRPLRFTNVADESEPAFPRNLRGRVADSRRREGSCALVPRSTHIATRGRAHRRRALHLSLLRRRGLGSDAGRPRGVAAWSAGETISFRQVCSVRVRARFSRAS